MVEGIETDDQRNLLAGVGINLGQDTFSIARPRPQNWRICSALTGRGPVTEAGRDAEVTA